MPTGNRHPNRTDRVQCRQNLRQALINKRIQGKQLGPHEIVNEILHPSMHISKLEREVFHVQWEAIRNITQKRVEEQHAKNLLLANSTTRSQNSTAIDLGEPPSQLTRSCRLIYTIQASWSHWWMCQVPWQEIQ